MHCCLDFTWQRAPCRSSKRSDRGINEATCCSSRTRQPSASSPARCSGWTYGYTTALGLALNLDSLDPDLAREAYVDTGIQRTSLFAEYGWTRLDNFGKSGALILTYRAWRFGLAMEF